MLQHATGETAVCVAQWQNGKLTVWDSTQYTFDVQAGLAKALKVPMSKVRVICDYMGGGFGDRSTPKRYNVLASLLTRGRPDGPSRFNSAGRRTSLPLITAIPRSGI